MKRLLAYIMMVGALSLGSAAPAQAALEDEIKACQDSGGVYIAVALIRGQNCAGGNGVNPIYGYLSAIFTVLAGGVVVLVIYSIVRSGVQYITSQGNPEAIKEAKGRLSNAIIGLVLFIIMFGFLNYLVPGRVFQ